MSASSEIFLSRQPILDRQQVLLGYQLRLRLGTEHRGEGVCASFNSLTLAEALEGLLAFVPTDANLLSEEALSSLPQQTVVFELPATLLLEQDIQARCTALKEAGYRLAVTGVEKTVEHIPMLAALAAYVKVDVQAVAAPALAALAALLRGHPWKTIANGVESQETREQCETLDFDYLQGFYFSRPLAVDNRKLDSSTTGLLKLINLLNSDAELPALEAAFKAEPGLTVNLLRLVNSVGMGSRVRVTSVRHAISVLGQRQLLRWLQLLMFATRNGGDSIACNPLMQHAALRGYFMEQAADACFPGARELRDQAFLTGLLSLVPAVLGLPLPLLLEKITVSAEVREALLNKAGSLGLLLSLAHAYDEDDVAAVRELLHAASAETDLTSLSRCLAAALAWLRQLAAEAA